MKIFKYLLLAITLFIGFTSNAAVLTWVGGNGDWNDANNWDLGQIPSLSDGVIINAGTVTLDGYGEANYINVDGGHLINEGKLYVSPDIPWYGGTSPQVKGMVIVNGSSFNNFGNAVFFEPIGFSSNCTMILSSGDLINQSSGLLKMKGSHSTGINVYSSSITFLNYGDIDMKDMSTGLYLIGSFNNYGKVDIEASSKGVYYWNNIYCSTASTMVIDGKITDTNTGNSMWNLYGSLEVNYVTSASINAIAITGDLTIHPSGELHVTGEHDGIRLYSSSTFRVKGDCSIISTKPYSYAIINEGFFVNHQKGDILTSSQYGVANLNGAQMLNYGIWNMERGQTFIYRCFENNGSFSNRPKGKLYIHGKLNLNNGSTFNNQGHMFALYEIPHLNLLGQFNNTASLNDVHNHMSSINNNTSIRVHKMVGPFTEGVPVSNVLEIGSNPAATVLNWYTAATGSTVAGSYNSSTNTFTPNANAVGLTSLFVRTRINAGGVTRRHELIVENGINGASPFVNVDKDDSSLANVTVSVLPNPATDNIIIKVDIADDIMMKYSLYNSSGQQLLSGTFNSLNNRINISNLLDSGIYFVRVSDQNGQHVDTKQIRVIR